VSDTGRHEEPLGASLGGKAQASRAALRRAAATIDGHAEEILLDEWANFSRKISLFMLGAPDPAPRRAAWWCHNMMCRPCGSKQDIARRPLSAILLSAP
jgi:hypothetical protein